MKRLLRAKEVAELLDVSKARVYELIRKNILPAVHIGREVRVDAVKLEVWIDKGGAALPGGWREEPIAA